MRYTVSLVQTICQAAQEDYQVGIRLLGNESLVQRARNTLAADFLQAEEQWDKLVFIDADISWDWQQLRSLLQSEQNIVGGVYPVKCLPLSLNFKCLPEHQKYFKAAQKTLPEFATYVREQNNDSNEIPVDMLATGFLVIDRSVLEEMKKYAPKYSYIDLINNREMTCWDFFNCGVHDGIYMSEDWSFCLNAKKIGFQPYLNPSCVVKHEGSYVFGE